MVGSISGGLVLNVYTLALAFLLLVFQENDRKSPSNIAFIKLLSVLILLTGISSLGDIGNELGGDYFVLARFAKFFVFAFDPLGFLFSLEYIDTYAIYGNRKVRKAFVWALRAYTVFNFVLVTASVLFNTRWFYYYVGQDYHRGEFFVLRGALHVILCFSVMLYVFLMRDGIVQNYLLPIMAFPVIVAVGGFLQIAVIKINMEYAATVFACLILLIYVQRRDVNLDYLTGTVNRRGIDMAMKKAILESDEKDFAAIMIDVDYFKKINDTYGHRAGDEVLECIAEVLRSSFEKNDIVGRFGGDEFCIITQTNDKKELHKKIHDIKHSVASIDWSNKGDLDLSISTGYAVYEKESGMKVKDFLEYVDRRMYEEKMRHHLKERRHII